MSDRRRRELEYESERLQEIAVTEERRNENAKRTLKTREEIRRRIDSNRHPVVKRIMVRRKISLQNRDGKIRVSKKKKNSSKGMKSEEMPTLVYRRAILLFFEMFH